MSIQDRPTDPVFQAHSQLKSHSRWRPVLIGFAIGVFSAGILAWIALSVFVEMPSVPGTPRGELPAAPATPLTDGQVESVTEYLKGMTTFDASLMWGALSDDAIRKMQSQGGSLEQLQESLNRAKQRGLSYDGVAYVGGYRIPDGNRYLFYVIARRGAVASSSVEHVWFVFTVDPSGKIAKID